MSVYLFMKRYAEEEMYRPHPALYRPRLSDSSDYSGQFLHPESSWPPPKRGRSTSEASSDISIQLNQAPLPATPKSKLQAGGPGGPGGHGGPGGPGSPPSGSSSLGSYQMPPQSAGYPTHSLPRSHPSHPQGQALPSARPPSPVPPPHYHAHMHMTASPC